VSVSGGSEPVAPTRRTHTQRSACARTCVTCSRQRGGLPQLGRHPEWTLAGQWRRSALDLLAAAVAQDAAAAAAPRSRLCCRRYRRARATSRRPGAQCQTGQHHQSRPPWWVATPPPLASVTPRTRVDTRSPRGRYSQVEVGLWNCQAITDSSSAFLFSTFPSTPPASSIGTGGCG